MNQLFSYFKNNLKTILKIIFILIFVGLFIKLTEEVWTGESIVIFDQTVANFVYTLRTPFLNSIMIFITSLANLNTIVLLSVIFIAVLVVFKKRRHLILLILTLVMNLAFVEIVKTILARPRPLLVNALIPVGDTFSYPSGHALISITFYGLLIIYLLSVLKSKSLKILSVTLTILLIILIGFSRIYLGVHWPSDVLASFLIGFSWLMFIDLLKENKNKIIKDVKVLVPHIS